MLGGSVAPAARMVCDVPVKYRGEAELRRHIDNLKAAAAEIPHHAILIPAVARSGVGHNEYCATEEQFLHAVGAALRTEYKAIRSPIHCSPKFSVIRGSTLRSGTGARICMLKQ